MIVIKSLYLFIVENGLGTTDELINDTVEDDYRIDCHRKHIEQMKIAVEQDGVELFRLYQLGMY